MADSTDTAPDRIATQLFNGFRVLESNALEQDGEPYTVHRTWRQRWLSRPWRPWLRTYVVVPSVPYRGAVQISPTTLVMHPATLRALRESEVNKHQDLGSSDR